MAKKTKETQEAPVENLNNQINANFDDILAEGFNRYAKYIIQDRALPELKDGLKPVQRRILYAMYKLNLTPTSQFKKCARTVGDVLGKYHPHGDASIYEALIRMAQDWKNNLPAIEVHGNKGSIDNDPAAAMRYTEARLSEYGQEILSDIDKKIYPFINNFDDTETEPTILSTLLPNLLVNGASGIAAGYATNIPLFNITELLNSIIYLIDHQDATVKEILSIMPGPDFPTAGIIINYDEVIKCYESGEGKITLRSSYHFVNSTNNKENPKIVITDIPFDTIKSDTVGKIGELIANNKLPGVLNVIDATDKNGISIELELSDNQVDPEKIMNYLYKNTQLQINFSANMMVIYNRRPCKINILNYLHYYLQYAIETVIKVHQYLLNEAKERYEIVQGLMKAISILDEIIVIIRHSKDKQDSIQNLINRFQFTFKQAEAIVLLRLYRLSNTDIVLLREEAAQLKEKIEHYQQLINDPVLQNNYLKDKLLEYINKFGYERKTKIIKSKKITDNVVSEKDLLIAKDLQVIISNLNQVKTVNKLETDPVKFGQINFKSAQDYLRIIVPSNNKSLILFFTSLGKMCYMDTYKIQNAKWKDNGEDLTSKLHLLSNEHIVSAFDMHQLMQIKKGSFVFATKNGKMKRTNLSEFISSKEARTSSCFILEDNDEVVGVKLIDDLNTNIYVATLCGRLAKFNCMNIPLVGLKAKGVNTLKLEDGDEIAWHLCVKNSTDLSQASVNVFSNLSYKQFLSNEIAETSKNVQGTYIFNQKKKQACLAGFINQKNIHYYAYDTNNNYVNLSDLVVSNPTNWLSLPCNIKFINEYKID